MDTGRQSGLWNRNPQTGFYEQVAPPTESAPSGPYQYYQPPQRHDKGRSFSQRAADIDLGEDGTQRWQGMQATAGAIDDFVNDHPDSLSAQLAQTQHINSTGLPGSSHQEPPRIDPDHVPTNLRSKAWSPAPAAQRSQPPQTHPPQPKPRQVSNASNTSAVLIRDSIPDLSPLQNLEIWSKQEKRVRVQEAEDLARKRSISSAAQSGVPTQGSGKSRAVSDVTAHRARHIRTRSQQLPDDATMSPLSPLSSNRRYDEATEATNRGTTPSSTKSPVDGPGEAPDDANRSRRKKTPSLANHPQPYHHAPASSRGADTAEGSAKRAAKGSHKPIDTNPDQQRYSSPNAVGHTGPAQQRLSMDMSRPLHDNGYGQRARNTGFTGALAAASAGAGFASADSAAQRGKAAYERRKSQIQADRNSQSTAGDLVPDENGGDRSRNTEPTSPSAQTAMNQLHTDRMGQPANPKTESVRFAIPPEMATDEQAAEDFESQGGHHRFRSMFHRDHRARRSYQASANPLEEWREANIARLTIKDLEFEQTVAAATTTVASPVEDKRAPWWEKGHRRSSSSGTKQQVLDLLRYDGPYEEQANGFQPRLFLKCGPLLRFTGLRRENPVNAGSERAVETEVWRGTVMIVTEDNQSDLDTVPVLRLFAQPMDLPSQSLHDLKDPVAGQAKLSRTGRALYVRPVQDIGGDIDHSRVENNNGLFAAMRTPVLGPQTTVGPNGRTSAHVTTQNKSRIQNRDGEKAKRVREVKAVRLLSERGWTFWRFHIEVELGSKQYRVAYRINRGPAMAFWVPPKGETMNIMFHSCNGFSRSVDPDQFSGPDPLWRDVLNRHQIRPFHVMIGGGDQIYNDAVMDGSQLFKEWLNIKNNEHKYHAEFTQAMQDDLERFYLERYAMWFSQGLFGMANSQIPMVNIWDDHDIIDGFGSYPHHYMRTMVFSGLGAVAHKYYMLFQHQSLITETTKEEPSWLLGESPGPYINEVSRSVFMHLGRKVAFLGLDCRTERMWDEILCQRTYDIIFDRCRKEIVKGETNHLIVLLGVPIAYPRLNFLENILTSRAMEPIKAIGRTGMLGGFVNKFDGGVEILDDLNDHWTAKHHKAERNWFIQELQNLAADKSVRITILGGDVHLGAVGQFYTTKKNFVSKDHDHRYMPNIISSAIVNTPPPNVMADVLNRRNKVHHLDDKTDEDMIPMFSHDVNGSKRNNMRLLPRRNYCTIREYHPGTTPPPSPPPEADSPTMTRPGTHDGDPRSIEHRFPPGSMKRTMSLGRGTANLVRRLSSSSRTRRPPVALAPAHAKPYDAFSQHNQIPQRANSISGPRPDDPTQQRPINTFHRRPTDLSQKEVRRAAEKGGPSGASDVREPGHIDLEGGLDISLNMEINQHDPSGSTAPYRLLVPSLWYDGPVDQNPSQFKSHRASLIDRLKSFRRREEPVNGVNKDEEYSDRDSRASSPRPSQGQIHTAPPEETMGLTSTGRGAVRQPQRNSNVSDYDYDDDDDDDDYDDNEYDDASVQESVNALHGGYNLSSPPIGLSQPQYQRQGLGRSASVRQPARTRALANDVDNEYRQHDHQRRVSAPIAATKNLSANVDTDDASDNDTRSPAEEQSPTYYPPGVRRGSKAERFFGIGDADTTGLRRSEDGTRRASLQSQRDTVGRSAPLGRTGSLRQKLGLKGWKT